MKAFLAGCAAFGICGFGLVAAAPGPAKTAKPHVVHVKPGEALEAVLQAWRDSTGLQTAKEPPAPAAADSALGLSSRQDTIPSGVAL